MIAALITIAILSQPAPLPKTYAVAECQGFPLTRDQLSDDEIKVVAVHNKGRRVAALLRKVGTKRRAILVAYRLGSREAGWTVWSIRGPTRVLKLIQDSPNCRASGTYKQAMNWPTAPLNWLKRRSVCHGVATWRGKAFTVWPCGWEATRPGDGTVTTLTGIGPGVMSGGNIYDAAGVDRP